MLEVIQRNPEAAVSIINYLSQRLRESQDAAKAFALDRAEQRVAALLVNLAERSGVQETNGLHISVRLTHQDLADMAGLTQRDDQSNSQPVQKRSTHCWSWETTLHSSSPTSSRNGSPRHTLTTPPLIQTPFSSLLFTRQSPHLFFHLMIYIIVSS